MFQVRTFSVIGGLLLLAASQADATTRSGAVFKSGQVRMLGTSSAFAAPAQDIDCSGDLLFTFTETANPSGLLLEAGGSLEGTVELTLTINETCDFGSALFDYDHEAEAGGGIGEDIDIEPLSTTLEIPLQSGAVQNVMFNYQALEAADFGQERRFILFGDRISFFAGDIFGQSEQRRDLAVVTVAGGDVIDEDDLPEPRDPRTARAATALNDACAQASPGSRLFETCDQIASSANTPELRAQAAEAFDEHQISSMSTASGEGARIQSVNVAERIQAIRGGVAPGMNFDGLSMSYGGYSVDLGWLPNSLLAQASEDPAESRLLSQRWGVFVNGNFSIGDRSRRGDEVDLKFDSWGVTAGTDYRFDNGAVTGLAVGYSTYSSDFRNRAGGLDGDSWTVQAYASLDLIDDLFLDATLGHTRGDFDFDRVVDLSGIGSLTREVAQGSTDVRQTSASAALNYRIRIPDTAWTLTPYGQFYYADYKIDGFAESGSVFDYRYPSQSFDSRLFSAGLRVQRPINTARGILVPHLDLAYDHESDLDGYTMQPVLVESELDGPLVTISNPDRGFGRLDAGFSWVFPGGNQLFLRYSGLLFDSDTTRHSIFLGFRWEL